LEVLLASKLGINLSLSEKSILNRHHFPTTPSGELA